MSDHDVAWGLGPTFVTGKFGFIRAPVKPLAVPESHGYRLLVGVPITTEGHDGFPDDHEAVLLSEIEDDLLATMSECLFVGVLTTAGTRDFYFYVDSHEDRWTPDVAQRHPHHVLRSTVVPDPKHQTLRMLSGAAASANSDRLAVDGLVSTGIDLQNKHMTNHYLYFRTEKQAGNAAADLAGNESTIEVRPSEEGSWLLVLTINGYLGYQAVANDRAALDRIARRFGGMYDGWGVAVSE